MVKAEEQIRSRLTVRQNTDGVPGSKTRQAGSAKVQTGQSKNPKLISG